MERDDPIREMGLSPNQTEHLLINIHKQLKYPRYVYKYRSFDINSLSALIKDSLWFSNPKEFNDPFEFRLRPPLEDIKNNLESCGVTFNEKELKQLGIDYLSVFDPLKQNKAICCFSQEPDNILLWAHYGQEHRGFCLQFDVYEDISFFMPLLPVLYKIDYAPAILTERPGEILEQLYQRKSIDWAYENEVRVVADNPGLKTYRRKSLKAICFGYQMAENDKETLRELFKTDVKYYQVELSNDEYRLIIK